MSTEAQIASLLRIASEDSKAARLLAAGGNRNAVYHCSQAAEKVIRAVLTSEHVHAGIKHLLMEMVDQVPDVNPLKPALRAIEHLGPTLPLSGIRPLVVESFKGKSHAAASRGRSRNRFGSKAVRDWSMPHMACSSFRMTATLALRGCLPRARSCS